MGGENSKPSTQREAYIEQLYRERAIKAALEEQRRAYERIFSTTTQSQSTPSSATQNFASHDRPRPPTLSTPTSTNLYPNIQETRLHEDNFHFVQGSTQYSSTSNVQQYQHSPTAPSAPVESAQTDYGEITRETRSTGAIPKSSTFRANQKNNKNNNSSGLGCVSCSASYGIHIYQCQNGHSSCQKCRFSHKVCGICSKPITDMRNITLEALVADMVIKEEKNPVKTIERIKCPNANDGCCLSFTKETLSEHLKECPYMELECPMSNIFGICKWKGKVNHLSVHFNDVHPEHCIAEVGKEMTLLDVKVESIIVYFIKIGSFNFLFYIKRDTDNTLYMTAQLFGTKVSASKWIYEIEIYNKKELKRKFTYIDVCNSISIPIADIFSSGQCAILERPYISTFFKNHELTYQVFLKRITHNTKKQDNINE